jgi:hypothetical protein
MMGNNDAEGWGKMEEGRKMDDGRDVSVYKETTAARPTRLRESEIAKWFNGAREATSARSRWKEGKGKRDGGKIHYGVNRYSGIVF